MSRQIKTKPLKIKPLMVMLHDFMWIPVAILTAYWVRFNFHAIPDFMYSTVWTLTVTAGVVHLLTFWSFGCYRGVWRFASLPDLWRLLKAITLGTVIVLTIFFFYNRFAGIPRSVAILYPLFLLFGVAASRLTYRMLRTRYMTPRHDKQQALIVGAGRAGHLLVRDILENSNYTPIGFLDDKPSKLGTDIHGIRVIGTIADLNKVLRDSEVDVVLLAIAQMPRATMDTIINTCAEHHAACRTLPSLLELADGRVEVSRLRPVTVEDLLGREPVKLDQQAVCQYIHDKTIIVSGAGGSIGSELCRQIVRLQPTRLVLFENSEFNLYQIGKELVPLIPPDTQLVCVLGDIRNAQQVDRVFEQHRPDVVFHAAAYKHVPMLEENIVEGIRNNIIGTKNMVDAAIAHQVDTFVQVSTDKTVNPTNVMGATKRVAELYCQVLNATTKTKFITTRFGNVLGSAGSVVPLFEQQIAQGGPVTVTHPDITRFFMTIPEATSLILQAGAMGEGGEIFVLDMGQPVKIAELAKNLIRLSGLEPNVDVVIQYTGLRPGEKMHEELFYDKEALLGTLHPKLMLARCATVSQAELQQSIKLIQTAVERYDTSSLLLELKQLVPEFVNQRASVPPRLTVVN